LNVIKQNSMSPLDGFLGYFAFLYFRSFLLLFSTEIEATEQNNTGEVMCSLNI